MFVKIGNKVLKIKDCKGLASLSGLAFDDMKNHDGALIYANSIWMPFVRHKLDLLFLDRDFRIVDIQKAVPLTINPKTWKSYRCKKAKYCLEIKSGLTKARELTTIHVHS
jgi:uncharacterized membrane protein (UPF0127 family)